jgi:hypothetical protein
LIQLKVIAPALFALFQWRAAVELGICSEDRHHAGAARIAAQR